LGVGGGESSELENGASGEGLRWKAPAFGPKGADSAFAEKLAIGTPELTK